MKVLAIAIGGALYATAARSAYSMMAIAEYYGPALNGSRLNKPQTLSIVALKAIFWPVTLIDYVAMAHVGTRTTRR